jgi:outer membrane protein assembly factor BamB
MFSTLMRALCAVGTLSVAISVSANDWPQWRGPERDGKSAETGLLADWKTTLPKHLWTVQGMGRGYASVSVVGNRLYTVGNRDKSQSVICVAADTGAPVWTSPVTQGEPQHDYAGSRTPPTIDGDRLFVVTSDGQISCLNTANGAIVWQRPFSDFGGRLMSGWGFSESPLVDGDRVICTPGGPDAMMVALDKQNGQEVWRSRMPSGGGQGGDGAGYSSIVISEGGGLKQYLQVVGHGLISVRASDGQFLWGYDKIANGTANIPTAVVNGDYVFASTGYGAGAALIKINKTDQTVQPEEVYFLDANVFQNHHGGFVMDGDFIYGGHGHGEGFPTCLTWKTGKIKWGGKLRGAGSGSAAVTQIGNQLLFRYQNGTVALINATPVGYQLQGTLTPDYQEGDSWSHPVVVDGRLYLREQDKLMCYDLKSP